MQYPGCDEDTDFMKFNLIPITRCILSSSQSALYGGTSLMDESGAARAGAPSAMTDSKTQVRRTQQEGSLIIPLGNPGLLPRPNVNHLIRKLHPPLPVTFRQAALGFLPKNALCRLLPLHQIREVIRIFQCVLDPGLLCGRRLAENGAEDAAERVSAVDTAGAGGIIDGNRGLA